jgi:hypothetical protein
MIDQFMKTNGWTISERLTLPGREGEYFPSDDLPLSRESAGFLKSSFPAGIYRHQKEAIKSSLAGENLCITTGTASGKSLPFYVAAMEKLAADPDNEALRAVLAVTLASAGRADVARRELAARRDLCVARLAPVQFPARLENRRPARPMNRPVHAAAAQQRLVRSVYDRVHVLARQVALNHLDDRRTDFPFHGLCTSPFRVLCPIDFSPPDAYCQRMRRFISA